LIIEYETTTVDNLMNQWFYINHRLNNLLTYKIW
jgi:hypothetical protein